MIKSIGKKTFFVVACATIQTMCFAIDLVQPTTHSTEDIVVKSIDKTIESLETENSINNQNQKIEQKEKINKPQHANVLFEQSMDDESKDTQKEPPLALKTVKKDSEKDSSDEKDTEKGDIYLNFNNVSLASVVNYVGDLKNINILPHKEIEEVKVTLTTRTPLTIDRAWDVLLTLMEMNGYSIIEVEGVYRIVPSKDNAFEPLPMYSSLGHGDKQGVEPENLPDNDMIIRYVYFFKNIKAETAQTILRTMFTDERAIIINRDLNACIIKDQCSNIKSALKIVKELDIGGLREAIKVIRLKHADAQTVADLFKEITGGGQEEQRTVRFTPLSSQQEKRYFSSTTKIFPDQSKNSLIMLGTDSNLNKIISFIQRFIDVPIGDAQSRLHIKEIRHAKAEGLRPILDAIIRPPQGQGSEKSSVVGEYKFFEDVIIAAEAGEAAGEGSRGSGNRLIIACNQDDWKRLEQFIEKLDKPQPQVAIEVMVLDINIDHVKELGMQSLNFKGKKPGAGINEVTFNNLSETVPSIRRDESGLPVKNPNGSPVSDIIKLATPDRLGKSSPSFITFGSATSENQSIWAILRTVFNSTNSHVISQPFLVANNHQQCSVDIKETRRIPGASTSSHGEASRNQLRDVSASIKIDLKPQINIDGLVDLDLEIVVEEFQGDAKDVDAPTKTSRELKTRVNMMTGEVLVLGGLTGGEQKEDHYRTPILADIPIIGNLFKSKSKTKGEENLYIFLRPSIIKPRFEGEPDEYTQLKLDYAKYQMMKNDTYSSDNDPIQRWFFKPTHESIKEKITSAKRGIFKPIDNFTYGKDRPPQVRIADDPYYKVSEEIEKKRNIVSTKKIKQRKKLQRLGMNVAPKATKKISSFVKKNKDMVAKIQNKENQLEPIENKTSVEQDTLKEALSENDMRFKKNQPLGLFAMAQKK